MAGYKHNQLRHKSFADIQKLFDKALKRVNTFVPMDTKKVESSKAKAAGSETRVEESSKRAGEELDRESTRIRLNKQSSKNVRKSILLHNLHIEECGKGSYKLIMSVKWLLSFSGLSRNNLRSEEMFGYILMVIMKLLMKKLDD
ncbi:hypothetical protein Tco_0905355 [Tanacetum coccineum]